MTTWIKATTNGVATKHPNRAAVGGIFRNFESICIGCFTQSLGKQNTLYTKLVATMTAIETAHNNGYEGGKNTRRGG